MIDLINNLNSLIGFIMFLFSLIGGIAVYRYIIKEQGEKIKKLEDWVEKHKELHSTEDLSIERRFNGLESKLDIILDKISKWTQ